MKYLSEGSNYALTSVADWKPISHERFVELLSLYATVCSADGPGDHGNEGMGGVYPASYLHARDTTATIWYMPKNGKAGTTNVSSPVLLLLAGPAKVICFEHMTNGLEPVTVQERMSGAAVEPYKLKGGQPMNRARASGLSSVTASSNQWVVTQVLPSSLTFRNRRTGASGTISGLAPDTLYRVYRRDDGLFFASVTVDSSVGEMILSARTAVAPEDQAR